jgi:hypothetical protein
LQQRISQRDNSARSVARLTFQTITLICPLARNVIELQHEHVPRAAVDTSPCRKKPMDVIEVPANRSREAPLRVVDVSGEPRPSGAPGRDAAVAVRASHLTLGNLRIQSRNRRSPTGQGADQGRLVAHVVESNTASSRSPQSTQGWSARYART